MHVDVVVQRSGLCRDVSKYHPTEVLPEKRKSGNILQGIYEFDITMKPNLEDRTSIKLKTHLNHKYECKDPK